MDDVPDVPEVLEDTDWWNLEVAPGGVEDVSELLYQVADGSIDEQGWGRLWDSVINEGGAQFEATGPTAHVLVQLLHRLEGENLLEAVRLIAAIAGGGTGIKEVEEECRRAVASGFHWYVHLLQEKGLLRGLAASILGELEDERAAEPLSVALDDEQHPSFREWIVDAYVRCADRKDPVVRRRFEALGLASLLDESEGADGWARATIGKVLSPDLRISFHDFLPGLEAAKGRKLLRVCVEALTLRADLRRHTAFELLRIALFLAFGHRLGGGGAIDFDLWPADVNPRKTTQYEKMAESFPDLLHWRQAGRGPGAEMICGGFVLSDATVRATKPVKVAPPVRNYDLTDDERRTLRAIVDCDAIWRVETDLFMVYGLPIQREELRALIA